MQIGFYTAVLGDQSIEEIARWAAGAGFTTLEVDMGRHGGDGPGVRKAVAGGRGARQGGGGQHRDVDTSLRETTFISITCGQCAAFLKVKEGL